MADLDLELRGGGGGGAVDLVAPLDFLPSVISSFFTQNKGEAWTLLLDLLLSIFNLLWNSM